MKKLNKKGFTLAELLIVVAIIAVLVAIAIPVFTKRLESSREATDMANLRSAYAAAQVTALAGDIPNSGTGLYFDPNDDIGVTTNGAVLGQGTKTEGGADTTALPDVVTYGETTVAAGKKIVIEFTNVSGTKGDVKAIHFEN